MAVHARMVAARIYSRSTGESVPSLHLGAYQSRPQIASKYSSRQLFTMLVVAMHEATYCILNTSLVVVRILFKLLDQ